MKYGYTPIEDALVTIQVSIGDVKDLIKIIEWSNATVRAQDTGQNPEWKWKTQRFREELRYILERAGTALEYEGAELKNQKPTQEINTNA